MDARERSLKAYSEKARASYDYLKDTVNRQLCIEVAGEYVEDSTSLPTVYYDGFSFVLGSLADICVYYNSQFLGWASSNELTWTLLGSMLVDKGIK